MSQAAFKTPGATVSLPCGISVALPTWILGVPIPPSISFPPTFPPFSLSFHFRLSCDPTNPVSVTSGVPWGGGRTSNAPPDPDDSEDDPSF